MASDGGGVLLFAALCFIAVNTDLAAAERKAELVVLPSSSVQTKPIGKNVLLTCKANVENSALLSELQWLDPNNRTILNNEIMYANNPQRMHTEQMPDALALIIPSLQETEAGTYTCVATYARAEKLYKSVRIDTIVAITWEDAPLEQYPILHKDFKVRCKVTARPAPQVAWMRSGETINTGGRYVVETDGLTIQKPVESDDGTYTCRAIVVQTGELAQRDIKVEVHTPPSFEDMQPQVSVIEGNIATIPCRAHGKPKPTFQWIKSSTKEDMSTVSRFSVNNLTGDMTINPVHPDDRGEYKCVAKNKASTVEKKILMNVVVKPRVLEYKNISAAIGSEAFIVCRATGNPLPTVTFRKPSQGRPFVTGRQPTDQRIELSSAENRESFETIGTLRISRLNRFDDGLYTCIAQNEGGDANKNGHLTIQFPPSFVSTPHEAWSWGTKPVNITCLAESIPNATITWKLNDREIENDRNIRKIGEGPQSTIEIHPQSRVYYGIYKCIARNPLGTAEKIFTLREATPPSEILQATIEQITATTITFSFVGPQNFGGRPLKAYAVQYKKEWQNWDVGAQNKTWPSDSPYVLENLEPEVLYNFRFAAINDVGQSIWAANIMRAMPRRSAPEQPRILNQLLPVGYDVSPYSDRVEIRWKIPADNGEPIDRYNIKYCPVREEPMNGGWVDTGSFCQEQNLDQQLSSVYLQMLTPNTFYRVELRAHNKMGFSNPGWTTIRTAPDLHVTQAENIFFMSSGIIVGIVVAALFIVLILIDLCCFCTNHAGILMMICESMRGKPKEEDSKLGGEEKEPLKEMNGINGKEKMTIEIMPMMQDNMKKDTMVDYDFKNSVARTGFLGKDSAV